MTGMQLEERWPDLFEGLDEGQRDRIIEACADNWHEGWEPNREDLAFLVMRVRGQITTQEYLHRILKRAGVDAVAAHV
ncbi:Uncharacterised protein [Actinomyces bovis]|uniref:Antitoxin VbhA domain-containing protein n=1 Tax=Actinomyces bovis TaxID=1658 RepID=A0ABY1VQS1_9ACTO|nr:antitoxin VbhA family protein [Actinomyces bovis]SPT55031.1 Uncharacterised protein [Actinomyces bovis]VEG56182.1 Uncharacterised protein [Actinomyces israelii]